MEFRKLIDKEDIIEDSKRLEKYKVKNNRAEKLKKIDEIKIEFISDKERMKELDSLTLIYMFTEKIKDMI